MGRSQGAKALDSTEGRVSREGSSQGGTPRASQVNSLGGPQHRQPRDGSSPERHQVPPAHSHSGSPQSWQPKDTSSPLGATAVAPRATALRRPSGDGSSGSSRQGSQLEEEKDWYGAQAPSSIDWRLNPKPSTPNPQSSTRTPEP